MPEKTVVVLKKEWTRKSNGFSQRAGYKGMVAAQLGLKRNGQFKSLLHARVERQSYHFRERRSRKPRITITTQHVETKGSIPVGETAGKPFSDFLLAVEARYTRHRDPSQCLRELYELRSRLHQRKCAECRSLVEAGHGRGGLWRQ